MENSHYYTHWKEQINMDKISPNVTWATINSILWTCNNNWWRRAERMI